MSHEIELLDGKYCIAWSGQKPWHGLGKEVPHDLTPDQMLNAAGLDWKVEKHPAFIEIDGDQVETGTQALVRDKDNKILTMISDDWKPLQNSEAFAFFHEFVMNADMDMETAGSLKGGQIVWALAKIKSETFEVTKGDEVNNYLLFTNPHKYGHSIDTRITPIRTVCNNTLSLALSTAVERMVKVNHRTAFDPNVVKETLGLASNKFKGYKERAKFLAKKKASDEDIKKFLTEIFPATGKKLEKEEMSRPAKIVEGLLDQQPGHDFAPGTWWNVYNGLTFATNHVLGNSQDTRLQSLWYGANRNRNIDALNKAVEYAEAS